MQVTNEIIRKTSLKVSFFFKVVLNKHWVYRAEVLRGLSTPNALHDNSTDKLWSRSTEIPSWSGIWGVTEPPCFLTLSSANTPSRAGWMLKGEERQYLQLRVRIWKMMDRWIGFKGLKLLSGERGSEEKKRVVFPGTELGDQKDSLTSEWDCSPELLEETLVWGNWVLDGAVTSQWPLGCLGDVGLPWSLCRSYMVRKLCSANLCILS